VEKQSPISKKLPFYVKVLWSQLIARIARPSTQVPPPPNLWDLYKTELDACRRRLAGILATIASSRSEKQSGRNRATDASGQRHLDLLRACLVKKIQVFVYGNHSQDWMSALAPTAPVWLGQDLVLEVVHVDATEHDLAAQIRPDCYPILLPLMEHHARAAPATFACLTSASDLIDLLANKSLFAAYLLERKFTEVAPKLYQSLADVDYPCVVKRTDLNSGRGVDLVLHEEALNQIIEARTRLHENFIVQSWVGGSDEYVTHAVLRDGKIVWNQTFCYDLGGDDVIRTAEITGNCRIERIPTPKAFLGVLSRISDDLGLSGPVNVDYKIVDGKPLIFEINPRLGGSLMRPENADLLAEVLKNIICGAVASDRFFAGIIRGSDLFDVDFYTSIDNEFDPPSNNPALHYFRDGFQEGRDPSEGFSTNDYIKLNFADDQVGINPLVHFEISGRARRLPVRLRERRLLNSNLPILGGGRKRPPLQSFLTMLNGLLPSGASSNRPRLAYDRDKRSISGRSYVSKLTGAQAQRLIEERNLKTVKDSWHYSWDLERFFPELYLYETHSHSYVFHNRPISYASAPAPLFSDDPTLTHIVARKGRFFPFWFLKYGAFNEFLDRRSLLSSKPSSNFPTQQTYRRFVHKKGGLIQRRLLLANRELFIEQFSRWKAKRFNFDGTECVRFYLSVNPQVPLEWFHFYFLTNTETGAGRGVMLTIEDGRSAAMLNLANEPGYGLFMIVEALRLMAELKYSSFNAGVSGIYHYKTALFLDTIKTDATGLPLIGSDYLSAGSL